MSSAASPLFRSPLMTLLENFPEKKQPLCLRAGRRSFYFSECIYADLCDLSRVEAKGPIQESAAPEAFSRLGLHHHEKSTLPASR